MKEKRRSFLLSLLIIFIASAFCLFLYEYDNKYTHKGTQAISGTLFVTEEDWTETPIRYLWNGWVFYPDELLTPQTYNQRKQENAMSLRIGEYGYFSFGQEERSPYGCGTYVMHLILPEKTHQYAIELPEIFSSYQFFVNDALLAEMGEIEAYAAETQNRMVTFEASDHVRLLFSVRNESHIYSGLVYPPAFGEPHAVDTAGNIRTILSTMVTTAALLVSVLAFWLSFKRYRNKNGAFLFFLLCILTAVFTSYPLLHGMFPVSIHPWYTLEIISGYLFTLLLLLLHNQLCHVSGRCKIVSISAAGAICLLTLLCSSFSTGLTAGQLAMFSALAIFFKALTSLYLLGTSFHALQKQKNCIEAIFYADIFYAVTLCWQCLKSAYEPIWGGWFQEWGCILLVITLGCALWQEILIGYRQSLTFKEEQRQMERQLEMQQAHFRQISAHIEESRRHHHDFRQHLRTIASLTNAPEQQLQYISQITAIAEQGRPISYFQDPAADALLFYYLTAAKNNGIDLHVKADLPKGLPVAGIPFYTILGNLLENALEACQRQKTGERYIKLNMKWQYEALYMILTNTFDGEIQQYQGTYLSRKHEGAGIGLQSVQELVKQLDGTVKFIHENHTFRAILILPAPEEKV